MKVSDAEFCIKTIKGFVDCIISRSQDTKSVTAQPEHPHPHLMSPFTVCLEKRFGVRWVWLASEAITTTVCELCYALGVSVGACGNR